jgi:serine protease Do
MEQKEPEKVNNNKPAVRNNRNRAIVGTVILVAFLYIIISSAGGFARVQRVLTDMYENFIEKSGRYDGSLTLTRQEVVVEESSVINVVDKVSPAVVSIVVKTVDFDIFSGPFSTESGVGTGFIVDKNGLIVTNSHVVNDERGEYSVVLKDGETYEVDQIHLDEISDLAILEISVRDLPVVELGDSDILRVGQKAIAIGNALGRFQNTVTVGVVSGVARELTATGVGGAAKTYEGAIQTDAALNPGNSGGPLLNSSGQVVGINVATTRGADNIGFAIPVNTLKPILETFLREGRIIRPYIGISYTVVTKEIAEIRDLPEGVFISRVLPDSPASKAGLERGDIVMSFDGIQINSENSLARLLSQRRVGDRVELLVDREGRELRISVILEEAPERF